MSTEGAAEPCIYPHTKFGKDISKGRPSYGYLRVFKMAAAMLNLLPVLIFVT